MNSHTSIDTVVIGAGQAGLALSQQLTAHDREHVVLERGRIAQRWRTESWDSLHLLSPNWFNALPGWDYRGPDPDGFMSAGRFASHLTGYARSFDAPVEENTTVEVVRQHGDHFLVHTDTTSWHARNVVVATGWCDRPAIPAIADTVAADVDQLAPASYRNPDSIRPGGVLVVGASATGIQLADELAAAGHPVTLAVGRHSRMPRRYRGMDAFWWLDRIGLLDKTIDETADPHRARQEPSVQLVGRPDARGLDLGDHRDLDLATLQTAGIRLTGRLVAVDGHRAHFATDLGATVAAANARMARVLRQIDCHIDTHGLDSEVLDPAPAGAVSTHDDIDQLDLRATGITTIIWATGYRRRYDWLQVPALDEHGELRQRRGVTPIAGLYVLGLRFQHRRSSNFIGGVGRDAAFIADHISGSVAFDPLDTALAAN